MSAQRHIELIDEYNGNFAQIVSEMEQGYAGGRISSREYKHFKRWQIFVEPSVNELGLLTNIAARNHDEYKKYLKTHQERQTRVTHGLWTTVSPTNFASNGPLNGRLNCIAVHPNNPDVIYVGAALGGIWKTSDGGVSWTALTDGLPVIGVSSIVINPDNPNNIYILTGDGDGRNIPSIGILVSNNAGQSWQATGLQFWVGTGVYGYKLLMNPEDPGHMFATTTDGIYSTVDGWASFEQDLTGVDITDIEFKPGSTDTLYASRSRGFFINASLFRSVNGGITWTNLGLGDHGLPYSSFFARIEIAVSPDLPDFVGALYARTDTSHFYVSYNSADTFSLLAADSSIVGGQVWYDLVIEADPTDASQIFAGGVSLWKSGAYGVTGSWNWIGGGLNDIHPDIHAIHHDGSRILVATDGGISKSTDGGITWTNLSDGLNIMQYYFIDVKPSTSDVMGGSQDNGTTKWQIGDAVGNMILGSDGMVCMFHPVQENAWYASSQTNRWRWDIADSAEWTLITPPGDSLEHWASDWLMHPEHPDTLYAAWVGNISRTYDRGDNWTTLNPGFTSGRKVTALAQGLNNVDRMYASDQKRVRRTSDLHGTPVWVEAGTQLPLSNSGNLLGGLAVDPTDEDRVWATLADYQSGKKVYYSDDAGMNWTNISGSLPTIPVRCIEYQPGSNDGLYIGTDIGVFYRNADMTDWIYFSNGLPAVPVFDIKLTANYIYAGTFGRGIWRSELHTSCPASLALTPANDPSSPISTGMQHYSASVSILSTRIITGGPGSDVTYQAGNFVRFDPGFHAKVNNQLLAKIEGCPD